MDRQPNEDELRRIAVHEIGHALVSERIRPGSVSTVTIIPRGGALGYVREVPEADSYLQTRRQLEERIQLLVAGSIAEEILFQSRSTGASNDFLEAAQLAKKMVYAGMSELGIVDPDSLPRQLLHKAVAQILQTQEELVRGELQDKVEVICCVSKELLQEEKLSGERLRQLIAGGDKPQPLERAQLA